jgi:phosphatidylinositol alpha-1,6-mannosyltransferase
VARTLLVTNDFPPRAGGIQNYLQALVDRLPPGEVAVYAPAWPGAAEFDAALAYPVHRHPTSLMLPLPAVARRAAALARAHRATTVWFGAAAPLALLGPGLRRSAGVRRVVASTHGHEVGWSMLPAARQVLRRIGRDADAITVVSRYTRGRIASAFGPDAALEPLPPGVDAQRFRPDPAARAALRRRYGLGDAPVVTCVSRLVARKGQDQLVRALPLVRARVPGARLLLVGDGTDAPRLRRLAAAHGVAEHVVFTGAVAAGDLPAHHAVGDVFALPCRTRGGGLDVEGLGIVLLEASASGLPVVAGDSGGAPETVREGVTGHVVGGRDLPALVTALTGLLADPDRGRAMGVAGREWMLRDWALPALVQRLRGLLDDDPVSTLPADPADPADSLPVDRDAGRVADRS